MLYLFHYYHLEACLLSNRDGKGVDERAGGKELVGAEGGETAIRIYYMRKKENHDNFSMKGKNKI